MKLILSMSAFYRGIEAGFSQHYHDGQHIIWITPDRQYAKNYGVVHEVVANLGKGMSLGFRDLEVSVRASEVASRVRKACVAAFETRMCDKSTAMQAVKSLDSVIHRTEFRHAFEWYMKYPVFAQALRACGYTHIEAEEANGVPTLGVLDPKRCTIKEVQ